MTSVALLLVLSSALLHAVWNYLYKRARDKPAFAWLFGVAAVAIYLPGFLLVAGRQTIPVEGLIVVGVSAAIHTLYFAFLGRSYSVGDLSLVYPLARGTGPLLVPVWAVAFLGERLSPLGAAGIVTVVLGVYALHLKELSLPGLLAPFLSLRGSATRTALFSGLLISLYTVVDKVGVGYVEPFTYMYLFMALYTLFYTPFVFGTRGAKTVRLEWRLNGVRIVAVGILIVFAYVLVLYAMTLSNVSYVAAAREVSVVFGAGMGTFLLKESYGRAKIGGSILIAAGIALISMAK